LTDLTKWARGADFVAHPNKPEKQTPSPPPPAVPVSTIPPPAVPVSTIRLSGAGIYHPPKVPQVQVLVLVLVHVQVKVQVQGPPCTSQQASCSFLRLLVDPLAGVETNSSRVNWLTGLLVDWLSNPVISVRWASTRRYGELPGPGPTSGTGLT
jgi:hypothetical protein